MFESGVGLSDLPAHVTDMRLVRLLQRLATDEGGQDLVEYGILLSIITVGMLLVFPQIQTKMASYFADDASTGWGRRMYDRWVPDDPITTP